MMPLPGAACTLWTEPAVSGPTQACLEPHVEETTKPLCKSRLWTLLHSLSLGQPPHPQGILCSTWSCFAAPHRDRKPVNSFLGKAPSLCPYILHSIFIKILFCKFPSMALPDEMEEVPATTGKEEIRSVAGKQGHVTGSAHLIVGLLYGTDAEAE